MDAAERAAARQLTSLLARARRADEVLQIVGRHLNDFDHIHTTTALHVLAKRRHTMDRRSLRGNAFFALVRRHARHIYDDVLDGRQLANTVWAAATLSAAATLPKSFVPGVATRLASHAERLDHQAVSNSLWAFASLEVRYSGEALRRIASCRAFKDPSGFKPQELSNTIWALATCGTACASGLPENAAARRRELEPQHLANVAWALATAVVPDRGVLDAIVSEAQDKLDEFKPQEVANTSWALASASARDGNEQVIASLACAASKRAAEFNNQEFVNICWAFAELLPVVPRKG